MTWRPHTRVHLVQQKLETSTRSQCFSVAIRNELEEYTRGLAIFRGCQSDIAIDEKNLFRPKRPVAMAGDLAAPVQDQRQHFMKRVDDMSRL